MTLLEKDLSYRIQGGLFCVQNEVGLGRSEEVYHQAFCHWLNENNIAFLSKPVYPITLEGIHVIDVVPDLVVENRLVIELKAKPQQLADQDTVQLYNYLKRTGLALGLLVNMGLDRVTVKRHLRGAAQTELKLLGGPASTSMPAQKLRECLSGIYAEHQTGYSSSIMDRVLPTALRQHGLTYAPCPPVGAFYGQHPLGKSILDCLVVEEEVVLCHSCLFDDNEFNCSRTQSFQKALNLNQGLAINFGKRTLEARFHG